MNPEHLFLGTDKDNSDDKKAKGREPSRAGQLNPKAKLTARDVLEVRQMLLTGHKQKNIGDMFGVTQAAISAIKRGLSWV